MSNRNENGGPIFVARFFPITKVLCLNAMAFGEPRSPRIDPLERSKIHAAKLENIFDRFAAENPYNQVGQIFRTTQ